MKLKEVVLWGIPSVSSASTHSMGIMNCTVICLRNTILATYAKDNIQDSMNTIGTMTSWRLVIFYSFLFAQ